MGLVVQNIRRADPEAVEALSHYGVATIHEAQGRCGLMGPEISPVWAAPRVAGTAITVSAAPCDNWMIHVAIEQCQPGDVMVVAPTSYSDAGYFGDLLGVALKTRGVRALVIDAGCRDVADLREMVFPVWSKCIHAQGTVKETVGNVNVPIVCAGRAVNPGDVIVADEDGVVVVSLDRAAEVAKLSKEREIKEEKIRARYRNGELGLDMNSMREPLAEKGLVYVDQADL